jgi:hypothetical protein
MKKSILFISAIIIAISGFGQNFEAPKTDGEEFEKVKVSLGADFALQLQGLNHEAPNVAVGTDLVAMPHNFNLPTANMGIKAELASGITLHMNTFLSARHHNETWVEGGYMIIDRLPFLPATDNLMKFMTVKAGVMSPNYGDAHFYRSNNASVLNNPFVGNWIMDNYTTNPGLEVMYRNNGIIAMVGTNNGRLNYGRGNSFVEDLVFNWKVGYDKAISDDLRVRGTASGYHVPDEHSGSYLWGGDRAGARYYDVMDTISGMNFRSGRYDPSSGQSKMMAIQGGLFVQFKGLDVFGFYETMSGERRGAEQNFSQIGAQLKYTYKSFFLATRYNSVTDMINEATVNRINVGLGWMMTENVVMKLDYVTQSYDGATLGYLDQGGFNGIVFEAGISF